MRQIWSILGWSHRIQVLGAELMHHEIRQPLLLVELLSPSFQIGVALLCWIDLFCASGRIVVINVEQSDAGKFPPRQSCFAGCRSQRWSRILERTSLLIYLQKDMDVNFLENLRISISVCLEQVVAILLEIVRERKRCACGAFFVSTDLAARAHPLHIYLQNWSQLSNFFFLER